MKKVLFFLCFASITLEVEGIKRAITDLTNRTNDVYDLYISSRGSKILLNPRTSFVMCLSYYKNSITKI